MALRSVNPLAVNLRLSSAALNPHIRLMSIGARSFSTGNQHRSDAAARPTSYIKGTVNEPTSYPTPNAVHGSYHWAFERAVSVALIPMVAVGMVKHGASGLFDGVLALTLLVHSHIGFDCCLQDYLHKRKFPIAGPLASWTLKAATLGTLVGLYEFNTNDIGLTELIAKLWTA
ncbi:hypothetical protein IE53DRAFT_189665 [Violaceomyces palustris]|uniref:Uncharacterized protein n=1 Tax=Violaceomyces palustris TaxID=1673888 RepID=A0ACD0P8K4_9BASI|nr:hypothetical protein IE53DRAFT_189665 [Violaceomyces palustris]